MCAHCQCIVCDNHDGTVTLFLPRDNAWFCRAVPGPLLFPSFSLPDSPLSPSLPSFPSSSLPSEYSIPSLPLSPPSARSPSLPLCPPLPPHSSQNPVQMCTYHKQVSHSLHDAIPVRWQDDPLLPLVPTELLCNIVSETIGCAEDLKEVFLHLCFAFTLEAETIATLSLSSMLFQPGGNMQLRIWRHEKYSEKCAKF